MSLVQGLMGDAVGKLYVQRYFPPDAKARIDALVHNLHEAYRTSISDLDWMTPQTRERALTKLDKFTAKVGYPKEWRDYSKLVIDRGDLYGNYRRGSMVANDRELAKLGRPVDRDEWFMTPQTVNAYYNPGMNEIVFPAAILQPPFFDPNADDAANYGGIGAVIGHEIGHGFDDQGAKYDGDGNLVDWWTDDDRNEFGARTKALIEQYDEYTPRDLDSGHHVNGAFTVGENIGDLGGLSIALLAYQLSLNGQPAPVIDGLTGVQRVFYGWAQVWRTKSRDAEAIRRLATDPHSPPEFRCNGVLRNVDAFYQAFDVTDGDALFLDPQHRVRIWKLIHASRCPTKLDPGRHVLVPGRAGVGVTPLGRRQCVRGDAGHHRAALVVDVVETEAVGQGRVPGQHRLGDLDGRLNAAGGGRDARRGIRRQVREPARLRR